MWQEVEAAGQEQPMSRFSVGGKSVLYFTTFPHSARAGSDVEGRASAALVTSP
jgi:hypothetical protein